MATYGVYCIALYYNEYLELWVSQYPPFNTLTIQQKPKSEESEDPYSHLEDHKTPKYSTTDENLQQEQTETNLPRASNGSVSVEHNIVYYKPKEPREPEVRLKIFSKFFQIVE